MMDMELLVTPEELYNTSEKMAGNIKLLKDTMDAIESLVKNTENVWNGEAGDLHRDLFYSQKYNFDKILLRLDEHPRDLIEIAGNYIKVEKLASDVSDALPSDIIQ